MANNYTLKYRTFDSLIDDCMIDFKKYADNNLIEPSELIKVARKCNYELGLRIYKTKEVVLEVNRGRCKLPEDFYVLNFAMGLGKMAFKQYRPTGTHVEDVIVKNRYKVAPTDNIDKCKEKEDICPHCEEPEPDYCECSDDFELVPNSCRLDCEGNTVQLLQRFKSEIMVYRDFFPINILSDTEDFNGFCPGKYWQAPDTATIKNGWIYTSFNSGNIYINYQGDMVDDEGSLLVPDHELLNEYYELAIKLAILKNLYYNDEELNVNKIQLMQEDYRKARNNAMSLVNTPNFNEMKEMMRMNRHAIYNRFYKSITGNPKFKRV